MNKIFCDSIGFCDNCGKELTRFWCNYDHEIKNDKTERRTLVSFDIKGVRYDNGTNTQSKSKPIENLCKKCTIKYVKIAMIALKKA